MKVGLVARCDDRGLGHMTWDFHRWVQPERTLVVRLPEHEAAGFAAHPDRYLGATVVTRDRVTAQLPEAEVRAWLDGLDVLYTAEVPYDWRLFDWCRAAGVRSVLHVMPESYQPDPELPQPDALWAPTSWLLDRLPDRAEVVPVPVEPRDRALPADGALRVLHVVGHRAGGDRNGTTVFRQALQLARQPMRVRIECQDRQLSSHRRPPRHVELDVHLGGRADRWAMYADADLLVLPRRYGGLCLPAQEAMACGLGLVMTDCPPNRDWPVASVACTWSAPRLRTPLGLLPLAQPDVRDLAHTMDRLAADPDAVAELRKLAAEWADAHSWPALLALYRARLAG